MPLFDAIELNRRRGFGYGLRQPGLVAKFAQAPVEQFPSAEQSQLLVESLKLQLSLENGAPLSLVDGPVLSVLDVMEWAGYVQRRARIPIFAAPKLLSRHQLDGGGQNVVGFLPYINVEATRISLLWAQALANDFGDAVRSGDTSSLLDTVPERVREIVAKVKRWAPNGVNTYRIAQAAFEEQIPFRLVGRDIMSLGEGINLKRMKSTITDAASPIGVNIARDKMLTATTLRQAGFPAVRHTLATSEDHAVALANQTGYPTVVKPADSDGGVGVAAGLMSEEAVRAAYQEACKHSKSILVETFVPGHNYRVTVCHGRIVKTTMRRAGGVVGDGVSSVADLVSSHMEQAQAQFRRIERGRDLVTLDKEALDMLAEAGMSAGTVPARDQFIALRRRSNVSTGGTTTDINGQLHPDNEQMFLRAATLLGLDFAGIDYISPDIMRSWHEVPSGICEINAQPQLSNDLNPKLYHELLHEYLGPDIRVPWTVIYNGGNSDADARALAETIRHAMETRCAPAVMAVGDGVWMGDSRVTMNHDQPFDQWEAAAVGRFAAAAVVIAEGQHLLASGLPTDEINFMVLPDGLGATRKDQVLLGACLTLALPHIRKGIVLDADDALFPILQRQLPARHLVLVSDMPGERLRAHLAAGGRGAWFGAQDAAGAREMFYADGPRETPLGRLESAGMDAMARRNSLIARVVQIHLQRRA